ncbi:MAG: transporter substrate-binding domain-containing protein [Lachnospiraceae bacterium]|nr:transporter substrate-binding domain-containing protein [Lachnospiraceae bacterium]
MKRKMMAFLAIASMTVSLLGCGDSSPQEPVSGQVQEEDAEATKDEKVWVVATDTAFRPFEYTDANGDFVGIDVDILAAVAEDQGFKYDLQSIGWDAGIAAVQVGQADALMAGATINDERKEMGWIFSDGYYDATQSFFAASDSDITSLEDLEGKNVVVKIGSASKTYAESLMDQYGFTITTMETSTDMYQDVINGNSAACVDDTPITLAYITLDKVALKQLTGADAESGSAPYGFAIMDGSNQELLDMFNAGLANIKENGIYQEILDKYLK